MQLRWTDGETEEEKNLALFTWEKREHLLNSCWFPNEFKLPLSRQLELILLEHSSWISFFFSNTQLIISKYNGSDLFSRTIRLRLVTNRLFAGVCNATFVALTSTFNARHNKNAHCRNRNLPSYRDPCSAHLPSSFCCCCLWAYASFHVSADQ